MDKIAYLREYRRIHGKEMNEAKRRRYATDRKFKEKVKTRSRSHYRNNKRTVLAQKHELYKKNGAKKRERMKLWYRKNPEKRIKVHQHWYKNHKKEQREYRVKYRLKRKIFILNLYGGKCAHCGTDEIAVLSIDHINDDGYKDRPAGRYDNNQYDKLKKAPKRPDLQVLCMNCQWRKRSYGKDLSTWDAQKQSLSELSLNIDTNTRTYTRGLTNEGDYCI